MPTNPKYPDIQVEDRGASYGLASRTRIALLRAGVSKKEADAFFAEATAAATYDDLRRVCDAWVTLR